MITEKLRPKSVDEIVGNKNQIERILLAIQVGKPVLVYGPPGIGKTSTVYAIANSYGYEVYEVNASDERRKEELEKIFRLCRSKTLRPTIFLFDEVDGLSRRSWRVLGRILRVTVHPIVLIANEEWRIPEYIKKECELVRFLRPSKREILEYVKKLSKERGVEIKDYSKITNDVRNSLLALVYGADNYRPTNEFDIVKHIFTEHTNIEEINKNPNLLVWLLDNAEYFYDNYRELFDAIQLIALADYTKRYELLELLPKGKITGVVDFPYFFRRVSGMKNAR